MKSRTPIKQMLSIVLAVFMIIALPITIIASAETVEGPSIAVGSNGGELYYTQSSFFGNPRAGERALFEYINGKPAYCIEPNAKLDPGETGFGSSTDWNSIANTASEKLISAGENRVTGDYIQEAIALAMCYGSPNDNPKLVGNHDEKMIATQIIIWEICVGYRTCRNGNFHLVYTNLRDIAETVREGGATSSYPYNTNVKKNYDIISKALSDYYKKPSFVSNGTSANIILSKSGDHYEAEITDNSNVLYQTNFPQMTKTIDNNGTPVTVKVSINGNKLIITSDGAISGNVAFAARKLVPNGITRPDGILKYEKDGSQTLAGGTPGADPVNFTLRVSTDSDFNLSIVKKDKNTGKIIAMPGFGFKLYDITSGTEEQVSGISPAGGTYTIFHTTATGKAEVNVPLSAGHTYKIKEVATAGNYLLGDDVTFTYDGTSGVTVEKEFFDEQDKGTIHITKFGGEFNYSEGAQITDGYGKPLYVDQDGLITTANTDKPLKETVVSMNYDKLTSARTSFELYADEDIIVNGSVVTVKDARSSGSTIEYSPGSTLELTKGTIIPKLNADGSLYLDSNNKPVTTFRTSVTTSAGELTIDNLYFGTYRLHESDAPNNYVASADRVIEVTKADPEIDIDYDPNSVNNVNPVIDISIDNSIGIVQFYLNKHLKQDELGLINTRSAYKYVKYGLFLNQATYYNGTSYPAGTLIGVATATKSGYVQFPNKYPAGKYYIQELCTESNYKLDTEKYEVTITEGGTSNYHYGIANPNATSQSGTAPFENDVWEMPVNFRKVAKDTGKPLKGAEIVLYRFDSDTEERVEFYKGTSNDDGYFENIPKLLKGNYWYGEVKAPDGYKAESELTKFSVDPENRIVTFNESTTISGETNTAEKKIENDTLTGKITITKFGSQFSGVEENVSDSTTYYTPSFSEGTLANAGFTLYAAEDIVTGDGTKRYSKGDKIGSEKKTDNNGTVTFDDLFFGKYTITETTAPKGYKITYTPKTFTIGSDTLSVTDDVTDEKYIISVNASKQLEKDNYDQINTAEEIIKVSYGLYAAEELTASNGEKIPANGLIEKQYCNADGEIAFKKDLPNGKYYIQELETSEKYILDNTKHEFTVEGNSESINLTKNTPYINAVKTYPISFKKSAKDTNKPLAGAEIEIAAKNGTVIYTGTTAADGSLDFKERLAPGTYTYRETKAPEGYIKDDMTYEFTITGNEPKDHVVQLEIKDDIRMGSISINKYGKIFASVETSDNAYSPKYYDSYLNGAVFGIYADGDIVTPDGTKRHSNGDEIEKLETTTEGTATSGQLYLGSYIIKELKAPYGYELSNEIVRVTLTDTRAFFNINYQNNKNNVTVTLTKTMELDETGLVDLKEEIFKVSFGLYASEDLTASNGDKIPADGLIEKQYCNADGEITFIKDLPDGKYYVKEISTSEYYKLDNSTYSFSVSNEESKQIDLTETYLFQNGLDKRKVKIIKVDSETGNTLAGAEIEIRNEKGVVVFTGISDKNGVFADSSETSDTPITIKLPYGTYTYRETKAPEGYLPDTKTYSFLVTENSDETIEIFLENTRIKGRVLITKTDSGSDKKLSDCKIRLYDERGNTIAEEVTDENGIVMFDELPYGKYSYQEIQAPTGYLINEELFLFEITENEMVLELELKDETVTGGIEITKIDFATDETLPNCKIRLYDVNGNIFAEKVTDENGIVKFEDIPYGKYYYQETEAPEGYLINAELFSFEILEDGRIIKAELKDRREETDTDSTETPTEPETDTSTDTSTDTETDTDTSTDTSTDTETDTDTSTDTSTDTDTTSTPRSPQTGYDTDWMYMFIFTLLAAVVIAVTAHQKLSKEDN